MKTAEILTIQEYETVGGSVKAVPVEDLIRFVARVRNRLEDIQHNGMGFAYFENELRQVAEQLD